MQIQSNRFGTLYGIKMKGNEKISRFPVRMQGCRKRGVWEINIPELNSFKTDNGVVYTK